MERLSGLDASFLYLESSAQLVHVCGILLLDPETVRGGYSFDRMRDDLDRRVAAIRALRPVSRSVTPSRLNRAH